VTAETPARHPLAYLLAMRGQTAEAYLHRVAGQYARMGFGHLACRREKVSRWIAGTYAPDYRTQLAMAAVDGIPADRVDADGWPAWLLHAIPDDHAILAAPWDAAGALTALELTGGTLDRRVFMITSASALAAVTAGWAGARPGVTARAGRRISSQVADLFDSRLAALRLLDDHVGSGQVYTAAVSELRMITATIRDASYTEATGRRLFAAAAEASRSAGWTAYDSGKLAAAERHYTTALRAAAAAGDPVTGSNTLAFWAIQHYSTGNPRGAVHLVEAAIAQAPQLGSARMTAMLHARACRAHARAGDARAADLAGGAAIDAYAMAGPVQDDLPCTYWFNLGEAYQLLGSSALNLGHPRKAIGYFKAASTSDPAETYDASSFPRGHAIYLARLAEAQLAVGDIDAAVATAHDAVARMGGVTSARGTKTLDDLRAKLARHHAIPEVGEFLSYTSSTS
jgi:tetratricopeptide (TPR) repeat protein